MNNFVKKYSYIVFCLTLGFNLNAQDTITLKPSECEARFIQENKAILLEKLNIEAAEANQVQAKLWENPSLAIQDVNLWAGRKNVAAFGDGIPPLAGNKFGKNQQFAIALEQLIYTSKKRSKRMKVAALATEQSKFSVEKAIKEIQLEFRYLLIDLVYQNKAKAIYEQQLSSLEQLINAYNNQLEKGNVTKGQVMRLKSLALELNKTIHSYELAAKTLEMQIKTLINIEHTSPIKLVYNTNVFESLIDLPLPLLQNLIDTALENRIEFKALASQDNYLAAVEDYEKAQKIPDLKLQATYDRGSSFMLNFVGFGVSMDLPIWNRNQGNIALAQVERKKNAVQQEQLRLYIQNNIAIAYEEFESTRSFLKDINNDYDKEMDSLLEAYTKNFTNRNMSFLEYMDFLETYLKNKLLVQETLKNLAEKAADLNYAVGKDFISFN